MAFGFAFRMHTKQLESLTVIVHHKIKTFIYSPWNVCPEAVRGTIVINMTTVLSIWVTILIVNKPTTICLGLRECLRTGKKGSII